MLMSFLSNGFRLEPWGAVPQKGESGEFNGSVISAAKNAAPSTINILAIVEP
jgi:hypothetical protein